MSHNKAHLARAVLEGVALNLRLILDALRSSYRSAPSRSDALSIDPNEAPIRTMRLIGGGGKSSLWPQILADCFDLPIQQLTLTSEATSWGAAVATGVAVGCYDWSLAAQQSSVTDVVTPTAAGVALYSELATIYADAYHALEPIYARLAAVGKRTQ